jgi:signal transduction histidine kinase
MRTLLLELRPATLTETSLAELLRQLTQAFGGRSRLPIELIVEGERPLPPEVQVALYRIAQEALNNITKHAGASQAALKLQFSPQAVRLSVQDDGRGFDLTDAPLNSLGLGIMRERAEKIGAQLTINSRIGEGTIVIVHTPVANGNEGEHEGR